MGAAGVAAVARAEFALRAEQALRGSMLGRYQLKRQLSMKWLGDDLVSDDSSASLLQSHAIMVPQPPKGDKLGGGYEAVKYLGKGAFGVTFLAVKEGVEYAVKFVY